MTELSSLDQKINQVFAGCAVRKDLVKEIRGNAIVPSYVLEYLLGQYCTTSDEDSIQSGIQSVKEILSQHYVHKNEAELIRSNIKEIGRQKVIDKISVTLNEKDDTYEASFFNLGINKVIVGSETIKKNPKLLVSGIWCIAEVEYYHVEDPKVVPWLLTSLKPIQMARSDVEGYKEGRKCFSMDEWIDFILQSMGLNPE
ncbi:MAG: anti-phage BREX system Lon protease BrxL, partial [Succinivibrio sp.]